MVCAVFDSNKDPDDANRLDVAASADPAFQYVCNKAGSGMGEAAPDARNRANTYNKTRHIEINRAKKTKNSTVDTWIVKTSH